MSPLNFVACAECHGVDGKGNPDNPAINGWPVDEFVSAMREYQNGTRTKNRKMIRAAQRVTDEQLADLATWYATLK